MSEDKKTTCDDGPKGALWVQASRQFASVLKLLHIHGRIKST